jgi:hypothetical protein
MAAINYNGPDDEWLIDSGASTHVTRDKNLLTSVQEVAPGHSNIRTAGGKIFPISRQGIAQLKRNKAVKQVFYIPELRNNLLSVGKLTNLGYMVVFGPRRCFILDRHNSKKIYMMGTRQSIIGH